MDETGILSGLRDIRLPPPPPDVGGGWQAMLLIAIVILLAIYAVFQFWRRNAWRFEAASLIDAIDTQDPGLRLAETAAVLRRVAMLRSKTDVGRLSGSEWLKELDLIFGGNYFAGGAGRIFGGGHYKPMPADLDAQRLGNDIARMLRRGAVRPW